MTANQKRRFRLAPEWGCYPLWDEETGESVETASLGLPVELTERIDAWDQEFQAILDQNYPPDSKFPTEAAEQAYLAEGRAIAAELKNLLGEDAFVDRFSAAAREAA